MNIKWMAHKGKTILYSDFRRLFGEQLTGNLEQLAKAMAESPTQVLLLVNAENILVDPGLLGRAKDLGKNIIVPKSKKTAMLGMTSSKEALLRVYSTFTGANIKSFKNETEAMDWLVE